MVLLRAQEQFKIRDESGRKLFQRYITDLIALLDELFQMLVHDAVFPIAPQALYLAYLLFVILIVLTEYCQQCFMIHSHT